MSDQNPLKDEDDIDLQSPSTASPITPSPVTPGTSAEDGETSSEKRQRVAQSPISGFMFSGVPASPPKFVSLEQIMKAAKGVSNMILCHEIAVNKDFKLEKTDPTENTLGSQVKNIVHRAFWDVLREQLKEDPPNYDQAMFLIESVKKGLLSLLLPQHSRLEAQINEVMDIELFKQQAEHGTLDVSQLAHFVLSVMGRICAPVRDDRITELTTSTDIVELFKGILELIDLMKLDMANFTIQQYRPHIQQHSVEYERKKFQEFLETQTDGLEYTREWLKRNHELALAADKKDEDDTKQQGLVSATLNKAYMELLEWTEEHIYPETLVIDKDRFLDLRDKVTNSTLVGTILLVTLATVGGPLQGVSDFKENMKKHLIILLEGAEKLSETELRDKLASIAVQIEKEVNESLMNRAYGPLDEAKSKNLTGQVLDIASNNHNVRKLMRIRILDFIEQVIASSTASPIRIPPGLSVLQTELANITGQFLRLVAHNRAVFSDYYIKIIDSFIASASVKSDTETVTN